LSSSPIRWALPPLPVEAYEILPGCDLASAISSGTVLAGRLGVAVRDTASGKHFAWRGDERFAMCSTFKFLAVAMVLERAAARATDLDRAIAYGRADLLDYAPVTAKHVKAGAMALRDLCAAAIEWSDNTAANLILKQVGGPAGLTAWLRSHGDTVTRLDRTEPTLNTAIAGDPRDTTTPIAMLADMARILVSEKSAAFAAPLLIWMRECRTADSKLRAGLPRDWRAGNKTGSGRNGTANDIAILWPPGRAPLLVAAYLTGAKADAAARDAALADAGRVVAARFG
ncbi:MAG: class A beta-lactamase, partial [Alphaproteobacteria bacterium]|nr:class A beta-lactamase [Alphaproteobacteria bacterium]